MKPYPLILLLLLTFVARSQLKLTVISVSNSACGLNNGSIVAVASDGVPPYEYSLAGIAGFRSGNFTSLKPGEYLIAARDATGTIVSERFFITSITVAPVPSFSIKQPSSCDKLDGVLTVNMSGGSPPFQYSLDGLTYQSSNVFTNLAQGSYHVYVQDVNGCRNTSPESVFLVAPDCVYGIRVTGSFPKCGNTGRVSVTDPLPGIPPRTYSLDGISYQDSATFTNLAPGVYNIRIKDAAGIIRLFAVDLRYDCVMQLTLTTVAAGCGNTGGSITAVPVKGEGPYQYAINDGPYQPSNRFDLLKAGTYLVKVRDVRGLTVSMETSVTSACPLSSSATTKDATCGQPNGEIAVTGSGGTLPYEYSVDGTGYQASNRFAGLAAATYTVFIRDASGGVYTTNAVISGQPRPTVSGVATAASCADNDGSITAVAGGQPPLVYSILPASYQSSPVFSNQASGNYKLMVKDGNGCADSVDVIIPLKNSLLLTLSPQVDICEGSTASLQVSSNASLFRWEPGPGITDPGMRDQNVAPLVTTRYSVTATTGKCTQSDTVVVIVKAAPHANAGKDQTICYGENASLEGSGGATFNWTPARYLTDSHSAHPISVKPASTLEYALSVTDASGCSSLQPGIVKITVTTPAVFAGNDTSVLINQPFNLRAADVNNAGFILYDWQPQTGLSNPHIANPVAVLNNTVTYRVTAKTASGCEASDNVTVEIYRSADIIVPNAFTPNGDGRNDYARPLPRGIKEITNFIIYSRWGGIVYRFTPGSNGWDGRLNGVLQSSATFAWMAEGIDFQGTKIKRYGTIILIR